MGQMVAPDTGPHVHPAGCADLGALDIEWADLAARAAEPNPFLEPWALRPALAAYDPAGAARLLTCRDADGRLIGLWPVRPREARPGFAPRVLATWRHPHQFLATPLIDRDRVPEVCGAWTGWARRQGIALLDLPDLGADGPIAASFGGLAHDRIERAVLDRHPAGAEAALAAAASAGSRKAWRRLERRLAEQGLLEVRRLEPGDDAARWIEDFLRLEAGGWKGREGTALAATATGAAATRALAAAPVRLHMLGLWLDGRPIALQLNLVAATGEMFAAKVAYDEAFAAWSPGVLLEIAAIRDLHARPGFGWIDSCASPRHPLMGRIWAGRRGIERRLVATGPVGRTMLAAMRLRGRLAG